MRRFEFTSSAPGKLAGLSVPEVEAQPTIEELVQITTALGMDMPELGAVMRANQIVSMAVTQYLSVRRSGRHITFREVLALTPQDDFTVVQVTPEPEADEADPPVAPTATGTGSAPGGTEPSGATVPSQPA